ncbi:APC family permease [Ornithinibacillus halophilus]|uniref:Amino acid/polyamine/organocation transporter, APC superfamily n=1 Tax=Ornithinibacillus halophilus TaxID=930117 RepID=A0A1M5JBF0_9BACI|nr:APC family permease [Ornithinibacillus halophilus]SHG37560.1 amino acid/polyamine/organocation transporter, APC superfamily [Ornithinibacillus halophilus]
MTRHSDRGKIGLFGAVNIAIGSLLGAAIYIVLPDMVGEVGSATFLAFLLGALPALFCSVYYIQLNATFPSSGGTYYFSKRLLGPYAGFVASVSLIFGIIGGIAMLAHGFSQYFSIYFPTIPNELVILAVVATFLILNTIGIQTVHVIQSMMVVFILFVMVSFIVPGLVFKVSSSGFEAVNEFLPGGGKSLFSASVTAFLAYGTFVFISSLGSKIKNPRRNTPLAMMIALITVILLYMGIAYTATLVAPAEMIRQSTTALPDIAALYLPSFLVPLVGISGLLAIASTLNISFTVVATELQRISEEGYVMKFLAKPHKKYNTPVRSLFVCGTLGLLLVYSGLGPDVFIHIIVSGTLLSTFITAIAALRLKTKAAKEYENALMHIPSWLLYPATIIGGLLSIGYAMYIFYTYPVIGGLFIVSLIVMSGFYFVNQKVNVVAEVKVVEEVKEPLEA